MSINSFPPPTLDAGTAGTELLVAERSVALRDDPLHVRISTDHSEGFWRVRVADPAAGRHVSTTTVDGDDSFLWPLIRDAVAGESVAWRHLAHWGHGALCGRTSGLRPAG